MAKQREDASYIKRLSKINKEVLTWVSSPLVVMEKGTDLAANAQKTAERAMDQMLNERISGVPELLMSETDMPLTDFVFLNKMVGIADPDKYGTMEYNYYRITISENGTFYVEYPTLYNGLSVMILEEYATGNLGNIVFVENGKDHTKDKSENSIEIKRFMTAMLITVVSFFKCLQESDLYAVETHGTQHRKVHEKKPWTRKDLVTVAFLNKLPTEPRLHKGGTHASPRYHQRRGTWRKMTHKRFKNHPKYGDKIYVKPYWAGDKEATVNGVTYKVL